jgi:hypothetical protein
MKDELQNEDLFNGFIEFTSYSTLLDPDDPMDFNTRFSGKIYLRDENGYKIEIGAIYGSIIEITKVIDYDKTHVLYDLLDLDQEIHNYMSQIWDFKNEEYFEEINPHHEAIRDALILDKLYIYPEFNGNGYGLAAIQRTIEHFRLNINAIVIFQAHPLQLEQDRKKHNIDKFNEQMDLTLFESDKEKATKSLMNYYSKANFKRIKDTTYMYKLEIGNINSLTNGKKS